MKVLTTVAAILACALPLASQQLTEHPLPAGSVTGAIGVCAHWDRNEGVYGTHGALGHGDELVKYLIDLGVNHYRSKAVADPELNARLLSLRAAHNGRGPVADLIIDTRREISSPLPPGTPHAVGGVNHTRVLLTGDDAKRAVHSLMKSVNDTLAGAVGYIEGPNEYDTSHHPVDTRWDENLADFMRIVDAEKRSEPNLRSLPLLPPSMGNVLHEQKEDSAIYWKHSGVQYQFANSHGYPRGLEPTNHLLSGAVTAQSVAGPLPIFQTETGYANSIGGTGQPAVTENVAAKYALRLVAEEMRTQVPGVARDITPGIVLMNFYELSDEVVGGMQSDAAMGLLRLENAPGGNGTVLKPKPIYLAIQRFIRELSDDGKRRDPLSYSLSTTEHAAQLRHLLLEKQDGFYELLLWLDVNAGEKSSTEISQVRVSLPTGFSADSAYDPVTDVRQLGKTSLSVGDSVVILSIRHK